MPVIPATRETEAGESLEPGRRTLLRAETVPLYSSLGDRGRHHFEKNLHSYSSSKTVYAIDAQFSFP